MLTCHYSLFLYWRPWKGLYPNPYRTHPLRIHSFAGSLYIFESWPHPNKRCWISILRNWLPLLGKQLDSFVNPTRNMVVAHYFVNPRERQFLDTLPCSLLVQV